MSQTWMIASGKGGVGKSLITASLAIALAKHQIPTVAMDTDIGLRSLDMLLGLQNKIVYDVVDVANRDCKLKYALVPCAQHPLASLLPAAQLGTAGDLDAEIVARIAKRLKKRYDYVLMDAPAGLERGVQNLLPAAEHTLLVVTPDDVSMRDGERLLARLDANKTPRPMLVVNRIVPELVAQEKMYSPQTIATTLDLPLLGYVPEDRAVLTALQEHRTIMDDDCPAQQAMERICRRFLGEYVPMPSFAKKRLFFGRRK